MQLKLLIFILFNFFSSVLLSQSKKYYDYYNNGTEFFKQENFTEAITNFKKSSKGSLKNTALLSIAICYENAKNYELSYKYYKKCASKKIYKKDVEILQSLIRVSYNGTKTPNKNTLKYINIGYKLFPYDYAINVEGFNYWYFNKNDEKASFALQKAINIQPENKILHFNIGVTYDNLSKELHGNNDHKRALNYMQKSIDSYEKAISIDSLYEDAYYNLGALYFNQSISLKSVVNNYSTDNSYYPNGFDVKTYDQLILKVNKWLTSSSFYLEKVLEINSDVTTLKTLKSIYFYLEDMENYSRIKKQLEAL